MRRHYYTNAKGQTADPKLVPPDLEQCQCRPNMLKWSPFSFGPPPTPIRCTNLPSKVIVENKPTHKDGMIGAMSLCDECLPKYQDSFPPTHARVNTIKREDKR